jgi:hypothetical protein
VALFGLGAVPAAAWRPTRGWEPARFTVGNRRLPVTTTDLKQVVEGSKALAVKRFFRPGLVDPVCGMPGSPPCSTPTPQAALQGLDGGILGPPWEGGMSGVLCGSFANAMNRLSRLLAEAKRLNLGGTVVAQAQQRLDDESSVVSFWKRSDPILPSTCTKVTAEVEALNTALEKLIAQAGGNVDVAPPPALPAPPSKVSEVASTVKWVAVSAGIIAGVVLLAPVVYEGVAWVRQARKRKARLK